MCKAPISLAPRHAAAGSVLLMLAILLGGCAGGPRPSDQFVAQAEQLHRVALEGASVENAPQNDRLNKYLTRVFDRLTAAMREAAPQQTKSPLFSQLTLHLVQSQAPFTLSTGGRHVYLYSGLLTRCENEHDLAAALAHQLAHVVRLDLQKQQEIKPQPRGSADAIALQLMKADFSGVEAEAADLAFAIYTRGGWDPQRFRNLAGDTSARPSRSPAGHPTAPVADDFTFARIKADVQAAEGADARASQYLLALPTCIPPAQEAARAQARKAIRDRVEANRVHERPEEFIGT